MAEKVKYNKRLLPMILNILLATFCGFVLIATLVYHWIFPPYLLNIMGVFIILTSLVDFIGMIIHKTQVDSEIMYECDIHNDLHLLIFAGSLIIALCFCVVNIVIGAGIFLYLLNLCFHDWYYKGQISKTHLIFYHRIYGKISYEWSEIDIRSSLDDTRIPMLYINLNDTYYLHIFTKNKVVHINIQKDKKTLEFYKYIAKYNARNN